MNREVLDVDFNILEKCCTKLGMELIPAKSSEFIALIDEKGNEEKILPNYNIFEATDEIRSLNVLYSIGSKTYKKCEDAEITQTFTQDFSYENQKQTIYAVNNNEYLIYKNNVA